MDGNIIVQELFVLKATAKVNGEIQYGQLSVESGAQATGNLHLTSKVKDIKGANHEQSSATKEKVGQRQTVAV